MKKLEIGQEVYIKKLGKSQRIHNGDINFSVHTVESVGKKYFEVSGLSCKFFIENLKELTKYSQTYKVYFEKQDIFDENELESKHREIANKFYSSFAKNFSLDQIRKIYDIIFEKTEED